MMHSTVAPRKVLQAIVAAEVVTALIAITTNVAAADLPAWWHRYFWFAWPMLGVLVLINIWIVVKLRAETSSTAGGITSERAVFSRRSVLRTVRENWINQVLAHSIHRQTIIKLGLELRPDMLDDPWKLLVERPDQQPRPLETGTSVADLVEQYGGLLILGEPGSGKTTVLLGLLEHLLRAAERDEIAPIPVVFKLDMWASNPRPLAEWLVDELSGQLYKVPRPVAEYWIAEDRVLPMLDGLDEVALHRRLDCARAIAEFQAKHGLLPLVVSSRTNEYASLGLRLTLGAAVLVQPLTRDQVENYIRRWGEPLAGLRAALHKDPALWELLRTPFFLSVAVSAYEGLPMPDLDKGDSLENRRTNLIAAFIERTLSRKRNQTYEPQDAVRWLAYIARALGQRAEAFFCIEFVDVQWLPPVRRRAIATAISVPAGIFGGLTIGLLIDLVFNAWSGLAAGVLCGLILCWDTFDARMRRNADLLYPGERDNSRLMLGHFVFRAPMIALIFGIVGGLVGVIVGAIVGVVAGASVVATLAAGSAIGSIAGAFTALLMSFGARAAYDQS